MRSRDGNILLTSREETCWRTSTEIMRQYADEAGTGRCLILIREKKKKMMFVFRDEDEENIWELLY